MQRCTSIHTFKRFLFEYHPKNHQCNKAWKHCFICKAKIPKAWRGFIASLITLQTFRRFGALGALQLDSLCSTTFGCAGPSGYPIPQHERQRRPLCPGSSGKGFFGFRVTGLGLPHHAFSQSSRYNSLAWFS